MWKEYKLKIILMASCLVIVAIILIRDISGSDSNLKGGSTNYNTIEGEGLTQIEALRLYSFFLKKAANKPEGISDADMEKWYGQILASAAESGLIHTSSEQFDPLEPLDCAAFRDMLQGITNTLGVDYTSLIEEIPKRLTTTKEEDLVLLQEFLFMYDRLANVLEALDTESKTEFQEKEIYLLQLKEDETDPNSGVVFGLDGSKYNYHYIKDYSDYYTASKSELEETKNTYAIRDNPKLEGCQYKMVTALVHGNNIIYLKETKSAKAVLPNAWIVKGKGDKLNVYASGLSLDLKAENLLSETIEGKVADLTLDDGIVSGIMVKQDVIRGKVLLVGNETIEVERYGTLPLADNFQIYKIYGELAEEPTASILVGYTNTDFIISDGKVCAALITEALNAENIRVVLNTTGYNGLYHEKVHITVDGPFQVDDGKKQKKYSAGEELIFSSGDKQLTKGRLRIIPEEENGKITVNSINRSYGNPSYRGTLEINQMDQGLTLVNELTMEEYLYAVVPSEMPTSYGTEALKVQAVCARSYAYNQLLANRYSRYGAHVDDSVNCQVYNNVQENESTILAVKDTYGKIMKYENSVVNAFYFSTSCGYTADVVDVWAGDGTDCFVGKLQVDEIMLVSALGKEAGKELSDKKEWAKPDLSNESEFRAFIEDNMITFQAGDKTIQRTVETYDDDFSWYRWRVDASLDEIERVIDETLASRSNSDPNNILTRMEDGSFKSIPVSTVGNVKSMEVIERGESGIMKSLLIKGSKNTIKVQTQTNIRTILAPLYTPIIRQDGSTVDRFNLLPSAFFVIDRMEADGKLEGFSFVGGGYGHGTGMSQNGVKSMIQQGKNYEEVLKHYYSGITLSTLYK